jgi:hypothetical protein
MVAAASSFVVARTSSSGAVLLASSPSGPCGEMRRRRRRMITAAALHSLVCTPDGATSSIGPPRLRHDASTSSSARENVPDAKKEPTKEGGAGDGIAPQSSSSWSSSLPRCSSRRASRTIRSSRVTAATWPPGGGSFCDPVPEDAMDGPDLGSPRKRSRHPSGEGGASTEARPRCRPPRADRRERTNGQRQKPGSSFVLMRRVATRPGYVCMKNVEGGRIGLPPLRPLDTEPRTARSYGRAHTLLDRHRCQDFPISRAHGRSIVPSARRDGRPAIRPRTGPNGPFRDRVPPCVQASPGRHGACAPSGRRRQCRRSARARLTKASPTPNTFDVASKLEKESLGTARQRWRMLVPVCGGVSGGCAFRVANPPAVRTGKSLPMLHAWARTTTSVYPIAENVLGLVRPSLTIANGGRSPPECVQQVHQVREWKSG